MVIPRVLFVLTLLSCLFLNLQAQVPPLPPCSFKANTPLDSGNPFPNELNDLKFYGKGKLSGVKLGVSTIDDVRSIFGTPLERNFYTEIYDYDSDWLILFEYIWQGRAFQKESFENGVAVKKWFITNPDYVGKISGIRLQAKKNIQFDELSYPDKTVKPWKYPGKATDFYYNYADRYGLNYKVIDREVKMDSDLKEANVSFKQGDIMEIAYHFPCFILRENVYVEQK
jgi:hypothetical protein